jgi:muconolactone delta-isomerase
LHTLGLWRAEDDAQLTRMLDALPLDPWMTMQTTPLTPHPSDPGVNRS